MASRKEPESDYDFWVSYSLPPRRKERKLERLIFFFCFFSGWAVDKRGRDGGGSQGWLLIYIYHGDYDSDHLVFSEKQKEGKKEEKEGL